MRRSLLLTAFLLPGSAHAFLGTELAPLLQLVSGQVQEIERLSENLGLEKEQLGLLRTLNDGIDKTVTQITSLQTIIERAQGLEPTSVRSLADLNDLLERTKATQAMVEDLISVRIALADQTVERTALQSDTAYKMGQEMVVAGSVLAAESQTASPGRAAQITAAGSSAQMLSQGVQLQTLAQIAEIQALLLEFQKAQIQKEQQTFFGRRANLSAYLASKASRRQKP